jgi:hypothetical protein
MFRIGGNSDHSDNPVDDDNIMMVNKILEPSILR